MKNLFNKLPKSKRYEARNELARAHIIIVSLSVVAIVLLAVDVAIPDMIIDKTLSIVSITLLSVVALISLTISISITIMNHRK